MAEYMVGTPANTVALSRAMTSSAVLRCSPSKWSLPSSKSPIISNMKGPACALPLWPDALAGDVPIVHVIGGAEIYALALPAADDDAVRALGEGAVLGAYAFTTYRTASAADQLPPVAVPEPTWLAPS